MPSGWRLGRPGVDYYNVGRNVELIHQNNFDCQEDFCLNWETLDLSRCKLQKESKDLLLFDLFFPIHAHSGGAPTWPQIYGVHG